MTKAATIPRTGLKEMGTNWPWHWRVTVLKTIKMTLVRPQMNHFKMTVRADCVVSAWSPLPPSIRVLIPWLSGDWQGEKLDFGQAASHPHLHLPSIQNKANLPFHQLGLFTGFWVVSSQTPLLVTESGRWLGMDYTNLHKRLVAQHKMRGHRSHEKRLDLGNISKNRAGRIC